MASDLLLTAQVSVIYMEIFERTYGNCPSVTQGTLPIHFKFSGTSENLNLLDELLVRANERRFVLAGEFCPGAEVGPSAGSNSLPIN